LLVRLFSFRPTWPGEVTDQFLRRQLMPALVELPGLLALYAARGSAETGDERVLVSIWSIDPGAEVAVALGSVLDAERDDVVSEPVVELLSPRVTFDLDRREPAQILRVFRGNVVAGRLAEYINEAQAGTLADIAAEHGPHALYLCPEPPDSFVTVSIWAAWERIQAATGGNIRQPLGTRHAHLLESGTATHYEIVPDTIAGRPGIVDVEPHPAEGAPPTRLAELAAAEQP